MAGTTFEEVFDYFMTTLNDYRLLALFNSSPTDFKVYLSAWLIESTADFTVCDQSLAYSNYEFTETLTQRNINMLVLYMKIRWEEKEVENLLQMNNFVQDRDFHTFSQANNMNAKKDRLITLKEELSQKLVEYGLAENKWANWYAGVFYVP